LADGCYDLAWIGGGRTTFSGNIWSSAGSRTMATPASRAYL